MKGMPSAVVISLSAPAVSNASCCDSITQGPAMRKKGRSRPISNPLTFTSGGLLQSQRVIRDRGLDERLEERMPGARRGGEFRVELDAEEPGVRAGTRLRQLHDLG